VNIYLSKVKQKLINLLQDIRFSSNMANVWCLYYRKCFLALIKSETFSFSFILLAYLSPLVLVVILFDHFT